MPKSPSFPPVNALLRGLDILAEISASGQASVGGLHRKLGIPKPTIVRNLETLEFAGFIAKDEAASSYALTARVLSLSAGFDGHRRLVQLAAPLLDKFRQTMPWPSDIAVFDGGDMVIVETNRDPGAMAINRPVGTRLPVHTSALGRAYLAFCGDAERDRVLTSLYAAEEPALPDRKVLKQDLARYRAQGFSENDQSLSRHTRGVGVPILSETTVVACINTIVLAEAMTMDEVIVRCVGPLQEVARQISDAVTRDGVSARRPNGGKE